MVGRVGRLLITLLLCAEQVLREPLLYLSLYFRTHRQTYYDLLSGVRTNGDWEAWLAFFAEAVRETAEGSVTTAERLAALAAADRERIAELRRPAGSALRLHHELMRRPISSANRLGQATGLAPATVNATLARLERLGIVKEPTGRRRNRLFGYSAYIGIVGDAAER